MTDQVKTLFEKARKLTAREREELAQLLLATLGADREIERAWGQEAEKRFEDFKASGETAVDAFAAVEEARTRLKAHRAK